MTSSERGGILKRFVREPEQPHGTVPLNTDITQQHINRNSNHSTSGVAGTRALKARVPVGSSRKKGICEVKQYRGGGNREVVTRTYVHWIKKRQGPREEATLTRGNSKDKQTRTQVHENAKEKKKKAQQLPAQIFAVSEG